MKPLTHAKNSVRKFGGKLDDYIPLHEWMDHTKMLVPDMRHRMILHNAWGIYQGQDKFGVYITNSDGKTVAVRDILEAHVIEDLGHIPTLEKCLASLPMEPWMGAPEIKPRPMTVSLSRHNVEVVD
jgi:hypothetical protein